VSSLEEVVARLVREPEGDLWAELSRLVERGTVADPRVRELPLERLTEALARYPEEDGLRRVWAAATGFALASPEVVPHGTWWAAHGRLGEGGDHAYDRATGMPLAIHPTHARARFLWVPPGRFLMGTRDEDIEPYSDQGPQHEVVLAQGFYLQRCPLTIAEEATMFSEDGLYEEPEAAARHLSWDDAVEFATELTVLEWEEARLPESWEYRLPTEAEWEYACRAGDPRPWYGPVEEIAWCGREGPPGYEDVGQKLPNAWGFHDMLGLVLEWCQDGHHTSYEGAPSDGSAWLEPPGPDPTHRVCRGGNVYSPPGGCTAAYRHHMDRVSPSVSGLRLVLAPS
jgi:formylglycine-generating enzyme required for sulfatase activity